MAVHGSVRGKAAETCWSLPLLPESFTVAEKGSGSSLLLVHFPATGSSWSLPCDREAPAAHCGGERLQQQVAAGTSPYCQSLSLLQEPFPEVKKIPASGTPLLKVAV